MSTKTHSHLSGQVKAMSEEAKGTASIRKGVKNGKKPDKRENKATAPESKAIVAMISLGVERSFSIRMAIL